LQGVTYPAYSSLRNTAGMPGEKTQTNYRGTRDSKPKKKQHQKHKSQCRMKKDNCSPSKANSTTKDPNICIEEELSNSEFQKSKVKMIHNFKEQTQKLVFDPKEGMNKQMSSKKIQINRLVKLRRLSRIRKRKSKKVVENLKNNQSEISNSISLINTTIESLVNRVEQVEK
jgi:hypothetical protein